MAKDLRVRPNGTWVQSSSVSVNVSGQWESVVKMWKKISGVWVLCYSAMSYWVGLVFDKNISSINGDGSSVIHLCSDGMDVVRYESDNINYTDPRYFLYKVDLQTNNTTTIVECGVGTTLGEDITVWQSAKDYYCSLDQACTSMSYILEDASTTVYKVYVNRSGTDYLVTSFNYFESGTDDFATDTQACLSGDGTILHVLKNHRNYNVEGFYTYKLTYYNYIWNGTSYALHNSSELHNSDEFMPTNVFLYSPHYSTNEAIVTYHGEESIIIILDASGTNVNDKYIYFSGDFLDIQRIQAGKYYNNTQRIVYQSNGNLYCWIYDVTADTFTQDSSFYSAVTSNSDSLSLIFTDWNFYDDGTNTPVLSYRYGYDNYVTSYTKIIQYNSGWSQIESISGSNSYSRQFSTDGAYKIQSTDSNGGSVPLTLWEWYH